MFLSTKFVWMWTVEGISKLPWCWAEGSQAWGEQTLVSLTDWTWGQVQAAQKRQALLRVKGEWLQTSLGQTRRGPGQSNHMGAAGADYYGKEKEALVPGSGMKKSSLYLKTPLKMSNSEKTNKRNEFPERTIYAFIIFRHHSAPCPLPSL